MEIISPSTYVLDCKCECGANFLATPKDVVTKQMRVIDPYWNPNQAWGDNTIVENVEMLECPLCGNFVMLKVTSSNEIEELAKTDDDICIHGHEPYSENAKEKYDKIDIKIKKWDTIKYLRDKYNYSKLI